MDELKELIRKLTKLVEDFETSNSSPSQMEPLIKVGEVAELLGVTKSRVYDLIRESRIPFVRLGTNQYRFCPIRLRRWMSEGGSPQE